MAEQQADGQRFPMKLAASVVLIILLVIFWAENRRRTTVNFYGYHANVRVWIALVVSALIGVLLGFMLARRGHD